MHTHKTLLQKKVDDKDTSPFHFEHDGVHVTFDGYSIFDNDELIMWNFKIDHGDPKLINDKFLTELKHVASHLSRFVHIVVSSNIGRSIETILIDNGFEHWVDDGEDDGYWWPSDA